MPRTKPMVSFGLYNLEISRDSTPSATNLQTFSKPEDLRTGNITTFPYVTYEPDFWLLDGNYKLILDNEDAIHVGLMSSVMSDASGDFASPPILTVTFSSLHSSDGLILHFSQITNDYADAITVAYYDKDDVLIVTTNYTPTSWEFEIDQVVNNFKKLIITFSSTNKPYRYLRLMGLDYGQLIYFTETAIKSASVVEEIDMLGVKVPSNACNLGLYSADAQFSIVNPTGYYARLSQRQPLSVSEIVNGVQIFMGWYYLDTWKGTSDTEVEFGCIDAIGVMDRIPYHGGLWTYQGIKLQYLIDEIMETAQIPYELDPLLYDIYVMGWIPAGSCRAALQQVAFAAGAFVDCSRSNLVKVYKSKIITGVEDTILINQSEIGQGPSLDLKTLVTGVEITGHNYLRGAESITLFDGPMAIGQFEITFNQPVHTLSISGAEIVDSGVNYAVINVTVAGAILLSGLSYVDNKQTFSAYNSLVGAYATPNILKITNATLINSYNGSVVVNRVYNYYQQRYLQKIKLFAPTVQNGQVVLSDTFNSSQVRGVVEKMEIDLAGGMIAKTSIVGVIDGMG